jgi:hypothetical protein
VYNLKAKSVPNSVTERVSAALFKTILKKARYRFCWKDGRDVIFHQRNLLAALTNIECTLKQDMKSIEQTVYFTDNPLTTLTSDVLLFKREMPVWGSSGIELSEKPPKTNLNSALRD